MLVRSMHKAQGLIPGPDIKTTVKTAYFFFGGSLLPEVCSDMSCRFRIICSIVIIHPFLFTTYVHIGQINPSQNYGL
jgi:hypothetical protein